MDPDAPNAWNPNDLNQFFLNVTTLEEFHRYQPKVLSRPDFVNGDTEETADYIIGPWVITLDSFLTKEEAERMIELGSIEGYKRSSDIGDMNVDGTFGETVGDGRTSTNAWCQTSSCYNDTIARRVMDRITNLTNIPEENSEYLQILQYEQGQYYREHHDFIEFEVERRQGPRMLTVYIYLNDVESGGGTNFPRLGLTVMPKQGRCLIWPSVMNDNPEEKDERTNHQALEVVKGTKYGVNAWLHRRNFKAVLKDRCI
jgi:prolyl 4-hydroxylase